MSLADKISDLLTAVPATIDPEDDAYDDTKAKTVQRSHQENDEFEEHTASLLRKRTAPSLLDEDERYSGKTISRKRLADSDEDEAFGSNSDEAESEISGEEDEEDGEEDESEEEEDEDNSNEEYEDYEDFSEKTADDGSFEHMKSADVPSQMKKAVCVRNQVSMWESILEMRIQLQKCLIASNKMPQSEHYKEIAAESGTEFSEHATEVKGTVTDLLEKFLVLQSLLLSQYPATKNLLSNKKENKSNEENEEVVSDEEENEEISSEDDEEEAGVKTSSCLHQAKRRKLEYYGNNLKDFHEKYKPYCNGVIQKWNDQTRIVLSKKNEGSVLNQIQYTLSDKEKLVRKTQLKRSNYQILGEEKNDEQYNSEIFDDDDFYHQLLRELIEFRSADLTDPVQLSRQWIQLQSLRSKMKRNIDTRATKGRKIRYAVHSKLVNFMAPMDEGTWTEEAKTDLFKSLFRGERK